MFRVRDKNFLHVQNVEAPNGPESFEE